MSDEKRFEQAMGGHVDRQLQRKWMQQYEPQAVRHFSRPAQTCEICGGPMHINPKDGTNHNITEWERKWSVHHSCAMDMQNRLDRQSGILSDRGNNR